MIKRYEPMKHRLTLLNALLVTGMALCGLVLALHPHPAKAAEKEQTQALRPQLGAPLKAAQEDMQARKYKEALARIDEAEAIGNLTPYEKYVVLRMRGSAALDAGENGIAEKAFAELLDSPQLPADERVAFLDELSRLTYSAKRYPESIEYLRKYREAGGSNRDTLDLLAQALYVSQRYLEAAKELSQNLDALEREGKTPTEQQLQLLASCELKQNDMTAYAAVLKRLVRWYPNKDYWLDLIVRTAGLPGFSSRLELDICRLRKYTGTLETAADSQDAIELALQSAYPGEAAQFLKQGTDSGVLGKGSAANLDRESRLRKLIDAKVKDDRASLDEGAKEAAKRPTGDALVSTGFDYVTYGDYDRGVLLMQQGIAKGGLKHPDEDKLHLGYAQLLAGHADDAIKTFKTVGGADGTAAWAELWVLASHKAGA
jgi:hypothetical protein